MHLLCAFSNMHRLGLIGMLRELVLGRPAVEPTRALWPVRQAWHSWAGPQQRLSF